jgi:hypothetical protein
MDRASLIHSSYYVILVLYKTSKFPTPWLQKKVKIEMEVDPKVKVEVQINVEIKFKV